MIKCTFLVRSLSGWCIRVWFQNLSKPLNSKNCITSQSMTREIRLLWWKCECVRGFSLMLNLVQRCLLHQLKGGGINLAVLEIHRLIKLLLLPLCNLQREGWRDTETSKLKTGQTNFSYIPVRVGLTSDGVMQSSTSVESYKKKWSKTCNVLVYTHKGLLSTKTPSLQHILYIV